MNSGRERARDPLIGRRLAGRFELVAFMDSGGMGRVYEAIQHPLNRRCAVKILDMRDDFSDAAQKRFYLEACVSARLTHPNTVKIFDYGYEKDGLYFIAMEFLVGESLRSLIDREGALPPARVVHIMRQICSSLAEAHENQLVHRDLKLSNIFLTTHGQRTDFVKVLDFGLVIELMSDDRVTRSGITVGSPMFMSPEQISAEEIDTRTDIYALGVVAFILLTGQTPFKMGTVLEVCMAHLTAEPLKVSDVELDWDVPASLCDLVARSLQKNPEDRFQSIEELMDCLDDYGYDSAEFMLSMAPENSQGSSIEDDDTLEIDLSGVPESMFAFLDEHSVELDGLAPDSRVELKSRTGLDELRQRDLSEYVVFTDINCPFCFALHERLERWGVVDRLQWRLVEHRLHIIDGPITMAQEALLAKEVVSVHHRAPDISIILPPHRCDATRPNRVLLQIEMEFPELYSSFLTALYRAIWQDGSDIDDDETLSRLLVSSGLPPLEEFSMDADFTVLDAWQEEWQKGDYDNGIPVIVHPPSGRYQVGLGTERSLVEFLSGERTRMLDGAVCYYQRRPVILVAGWMSHVWSLIQHLRGCCEIIQVPNPDEIERIIGEQSEPELLLVQRELFTTVRLQAIAQVARHRSVLWVLFDQTASLDVEVEALSMGASDYLSLDQDASIGRARLHRVLASRMTPEYLDRRANEDTLTRLPTRRKFIERVEEEWQRGLRTKSSLALILIDLDDFNSFNWAGGYDVGNQCLLRVAQSLRESIRPGDYVARFGGNEFALILPDTNEESVRVEAERLRVVIADLQVKRPDIHNRNHLTTTLSTASVKPTDGNSYSEVFDILDRRMLRGKEAGGNRVCSDDSLTA